MAVDTRTARRVGAPETVFVDRFCDGIIGPSTEVLGPVRDGGHIVANTAPGCWGPMITPAIKGGHEVTLPVAVEGAEVGDAIAIRIRDITVTSLATSSGNDRIIDGPLQRRPVLRQGLPGLRRGRRADRAGGHRRGRRALRRLRRESPRRSRSPTATRSRSTTSGRLGVTVGAAAGRGVRPARARSRRCRPARSSTRS